MAPIATLFTIIFLEGYIVLSTELLAIRLLVPFTGSGTDTVSIIIAAVLLPLAFGYYFGGKYKGGVRTKNGITSIRTKLISNLVIAAAFLTLGLSYMFLDWAFVALQKTFGANNRLVLTSIYAGVFLIYPIYLLGQTVPLISNYFSRERLSVVAGRMLFFSTIGSFMGAVFGTLVLMAFLGVHNTVNITIGCMALLVVILSKKKLGLPVIMIIAFLSLTLTLNGGHAMQYMNIISNNQYNTAQVENHDEAGIRALRLNRSYASIVYQHSPEAYAEYLIFIEDNFLQRIMDGSAPKKKILVLGAGGFALGREDKHNDYTYVDIDPSLKKISEEDFLQEPLSPNKKFVVMDARAYLTQSTDKYDMIVVDLFRDPVSVPENLTTLEFHEEVRDHLNPEGVMVGNYFASPNFSDAYTRNLDVTMRKAFPTLNRQIIGNFDGWRRAEDWTNIVYSYVHHPDANLKTYTDNKNTAPYDRPLQILRTVK